MAVEEKSVIDYNIGNPDGVLSPGETPRVPRDPLVAIYPKEGTLFSDSPFIVLDTEWVDADEKAAAALFEDVRPAAREPAARCSSTGSGRTTRPSRWPTRSSPPTASTRPSRRPSSRCRRPRCSIGILDSWAELRKDARVLLVLDISGSMGEIVADDGKTRLDLAQQAAISALDQFKDADDVGLWVFSTDLGGPDPNVRELVPIGPIGEQHDGHRRRPSTTQFPTNGTPLYDVTETGVRRRCSTSYDPAKINAIVLLTDGENDDGDADDDDQQFARPHRHAAAGQRGRRRRSRCGCSRSPTATTPTQLTLRAIAQATQAATYNASNPATIDQVFTAVISNF